MKLSMIARSKFFLIILFCILLSACDFQLREPKALNPQLQIMYVATSTPNDPFVQQLNRMLVANNITLVDDPKQAQSTLTIISITSSNSMVNSGGVNVSGFYTAYLTVTFMVTDSKGNILIPQTTLEQNQNFSSSASQFLSGNSIAAQLTSSMQQALAQNIITQLTRLPTNTQ